MLPKYYIAKLAEQRFSCGHQRWLCMTNNRRLVFAALIAAGVLWGTTVPLSKLALGWLAPAWLAFGRFGVAATVLLLAAGRGAGGRDQVRTLCRPAVLASGAVGYGCSVLLQNLGIVRTSVTHAALIVGATPVLIAIIAAVWRRTVARPVAWAGFAVSLAGVGLVASGRGGGATLGGDGLVLASQLISAGFTVAQSRFLRGRDPVAVTGVQFLGAAIVMLPIAALTEGAPAAPSGPGSLVATAALALCGTVLPFTLFADVAGAFLNLEPLVGAVLGAMAFRDPVGPLQAAGGAAVLIGIGLSILHLRRAPAAPPAEPVPQAQPPLPAQPVSRARSIWPAATMTGTSAGPAAWAQGPMAGRLTLLASRPGRWHVRQHPGHTGPHRTVPPGRAERPSRPGLPAVARGRRAVPRRRARSLARPGRPRQASSGPTAKRAAPRPMKLTTESRH
jgi:O-acetylserine/cysteine efflux transporter